MFVLDVVYTFNVYVKIVNFIRRMILSYGTLYIMNLSIRSINKGILYKTTPMQVLM